MLSEDILKLMIRDHIRVCSLISDEMEVARNSTFDFSMKVRDLEYNYDNELADLYLLLEEYLDVDTIERRRQEFREKEELNGRTH